MAKALLVKRHDGDETLLNLETGQHFRLQLTGGANDSPVLHWDNHPTTELFPLPIAEVDFDSTLTVLLEKYRKAHEEYYSKEKPDEQA